jgi:hypothetical protein
MDRQGYADRIRVNVERLFSYQHPDGSWPMRFGEKELPADFQTGHCLFTLAFAGVSAEDPRVARGVRYLLSRQQPFGGWFDHDDPKKSNPYENFRTPFYESQFAVMALAQLYPSTTTVAKGWKGGTESEVSLASNDQWHTLLEQVEQIWDVGDSETTHGVVAALGHNNVLVREAAARCLARIGDAESVKPLLVALGDRSKMVRRAAAFALRDLGNRGLAKDTVADALRDENALARRGALRVFAQHFRYWIDAEDARRVIIDRLMCDIDPYIRMMACRTLWQWWQWDADESVRGAIEDKFIERMAVEDHPWVRSNLIEGFTNLCDENTRYLYNNWIALLGTTADREKATSGHHASGTRQGKKIAAALAAGSELQIQSLLQAIGYFHLRTGTYAAKGRFGRIGNDVEAVQFYAEVAPLLKRSLSPLVSSSKPEIRGPALLAAYSLRGTGSEDELGVPFLQGLADPDEFTRGVATELHASFPPPVNEATEPAVLDAIATLMSSNIPEARKAALEQIGKLKFSSDGRAVLSRSVMNYFAHADDDLLRQALIAVAGLPSLWTEPVVIKRVADAIQSKNKVHRQAAVRLAMMSDTLGGVTVIRSRLDSVFGSSDAAIRTSLLELAQTNEALLKHARVAHLVSDAMAGSAQAVRQLALDLVRRSVDLQSNAAVRAALAELLQDPNERTRQIAETLYSGTRLPRDVDVADLLDFEYFKRKVQPVFFAFGPDQKACVQCHHNHGILKLTAPPDGSPITDEISRDNYRSALRVVNLAAPEKSLILQKPLGSADVEGVVDAQAVSHGGEQRWPAGSASPEYQSILSWINGGRIEARP